MNDLIELKSDLEAAYTAAEELDVDDEYLHGILTAIVMTTARIDRRIEEMYFDDVEEE